VKEATTSSFRGLIRGKEEGKAESDRNHVEFGDRREKVGHDGNRNRLVRGPRPHGDRKGRRHGKLGEASESGVKSSEKEEARKEKKQNRGRAET
jgi:hypothetical protein